MPEVLVIADDLTGALDSAVAFAERGLSVRAALGVEHLAEAMGQGVDVVAVATGTRELPASDAAETMARIGEVIAGFPGVLFKKIDSRLKGNVATELEALQLFAARPVFICPAIPRLGRFVREGAVCGNGVAAPLDIRRVVGGDGAIVDAENDSEIDAALPEDLARSLFVGAAGLAEALARHLVPSVGQPVRLTLPAPALWAIGSRDPITRSQLAQLGDLRAVAAPNGVVPEVQPDADLTLVYLADGDEEIAAHAAGAAFARGIAGLVGTQLPATLFACGGETAREILQALGVGLLDVQGEALAGVPVARAVDGCPGMMVVTKSGGFGAPDALVKLRALSSAVSA